MMDEVIEQGTQTLKKTPDMLPVLKEAGVVDAGGKGLLVIYRGFKMALDGEAVTDSVVLETDEPVADFSATPGGEEIEYAYCTEFFIKNIHESVTREDIDRYREKLMKIGDCVLVVTICTLSKRMCIPAPGKALRFAALRRRLSRIKIDNMLNSIPN